MVEVVGGAPRIGRQVHLAQADARIAGERDQRLGDERSALGPPRGRRRRSRPRSCGTACTPWHGWRSRPRSRSRCAPDRIRRRTWPSRCPSPPPRSSAGMARLPSSRPCKRSSPCSNAACAEASSATACRTGAAAATPTRIAAKIRIKYPHSRRLPPFPPAMRDRALARRPHLVRIFSQYAALIGDSAAPSRPCAALASSASLTSRSSVPFSASMEIMSPSSHQRDRSAERRLRADVADAEAARGAREAPVGDQRHLVAGALPVERRRRGQHLAHAGAALRALVADDEDLAVLVLTPLDGREAVLLAVEHARGAAELELRHAGDLDDRTFRRQRALEAHDAAGGRDGIGDRINDLLICIELHVLEVLLDGLAGDREAVLVQVAAVEQRAHDLGHAADVVDVLGHVLCRRASGRRCRASS